MNLPSGVYERLRQPELIAKDAWAIIRINSEENEGHNQGYEIRPRNFREHIFPYLHGDWEEFDRLFRLSPTRRYYVQGEEQKSQVLYSGAEHYGAQRRRAEHYGNPLGSFVKLPNITVVPNFSTEESRGLARPHTLFGSTMGHYHPQAPTGPRIQEVYEFQSYGCLALDREEGRVELWVAQDGDKVAVPSGCHMTLYNLGDKDHPLITLDFADPERNPSTKDLVQTYGPVLLAYYDDFEVVFTLNRLYVNNPGHRAGVWLSHVLREPREREVRIQRGGRLDLGRLLYEELTLNPERIGEFACLGIRIKKATPEAVLEPFSSGKDARLYFSQPLVEATAAGTEVYRYFFRHCEPLRPKAPWHPLAGGRSRPKRATSEALSSRSPFALNRDLVVVVEGVGDWVEQAYRKLFKDKVKEGRQLSIFYADDTRWKGRPAWAEPSSTSEERLADWETYLDKADPDDFARYRLLRPDVVFVVTPDFTHSAVARNWIGKSPLVFVEKPFDSQVKSVEDLQRELSDSKSTVIFGLDHYQFYALPIDGLKAEVDRHLGWALARVEFCLLEERLIEIDRVRSLQYGLTLDLLPHLTALLTYFGKVKTIDQIRVLDVRRYEPLEAADPRDQKKKRRIAEEFRNETYSRVHFTFKDESDSEFPVPCQALVGKGCTQEVKYLEVVGYSGNAIRVDLRAVPSPNPRPDYPWDSLFFIKRDHQPLSSELVEREVVDPYDPARTLRILEDPSDPSRWHPRLKRKRYWELLDDLLDGTESAIGGTISLAEGLEIVRALDRIWSAIQRATPWGKYQPGNFSPLAELRRNESAPRREEWRTE